MRAIVCTDYGPPDVLQLRDVPKPVPKDNEVLVRIRATTVSAADCELRRFDFAPWIWVPMRLAFGIRRPRRRVLGQELAGDVDAVGKKVRSLRKGDRVFAATGIPLGAYAEYICLRENPQTGAITTMPANLRYEEAAAVPYGGGEALLFLRKADVRSDGRTLTNTSDRETIMKAIAQDRYGAPDALELRDVDRPVVGDDDVLVRVHAASANPYDLHFMRGLPYIVRGVASRAGFGLRGPRRSIRGRDLAGHVEAVGKRVTQLRPGDEVYGVGHGTFAGYVCASESELAPKPANLTFAQAAAMPVAGVTALRALRDHGRVQPGQTVLINGAAGGVGTFAVQIAKAFGADTTGVCSTRNVELVRSIGADHVIDYTAEDFTRGPKRYDLILDLVGNHSVAACRRALAPNGMLLLSHGGRSRWIGPMGQILSALVMSKFVGQKLFAFTAHVTTQDLVALKQLAEGGQVTPVIDRTYPLGESPDAIRYLEAGHARGKVVIAV